MLNKHNDAYVRRWMSQTHAAPHALRAPNAVFHSQERELTGVNQQDGARCRDEPTLNASRSVGKVSCNDSAYSTQPTTLLFK